MVRRGYRVGQHGDRSRIVIGLDRDDTLGESPDELDLHPPEIQAHVDPPSPADTASAAVVDYDRVDVDDVSLGAATGVELLPIAPSEVRNRYRGMSDVSPLENEIQAGLEDVTTPTEVRTRSLRVAMGMEELDHAHGLAP